MVRRSSEGITITINPREGNYEGMLQERAWQVVFFSVEEPSYVRINGEETNDWTYDEQLRHLTVNISTRPCSEAIIINVKEKETAIDNVNAINYIQDIYDLQGRKWTNRKPQKGVYIQNGKKILNTLKP